MLLVLAPFLVVFIWNVLEKGKTLLQTSPCLEPDVLCEIHCLPQHH